MLFRQYIGDHRILSTLSVLLEIDITPSGDQMDVDPSPEPPRSFTKPSPKPETKEEETENLTIDQIKV